MSAKCLLLFVVTLPLAGVCSPESIGQAATALLEVQRGLLTIQQEDMDTRVPPAARQGILKMKDAIAQMAHAYMACRTEPLDAQQIERDLSALVPAEGGVSGNDAKYGSALSYRVTVTPDIRHLVSITATFGIHCGSDAMLLIYAPRENSWHQVLRWQSPIYDKISGAFGAFQHRISPGGPWFVVACSVKPWCSSTWSNIDYAILRPGSPSKVLLRRSEMMWWGGDDFGTLAATQDTAEVRYHSNSIDPGVHNRLFIRRYQIAGDSIKRVLPVAISPRDFVDEWIVSAWAEAQHWSAPGLETFHRQAKKHADEFLSAQACSHHPDTVQIAIADMDTDRVSYFRVTGKTSFTMTAVRTTPDPRCSGPNILDTMSTK